MTLDLDEVRILDDADPLAAFRARFVVDDPGLVHLDGGPGAPAFLHVRSSLQVDLRNPIQGWLGQRDLGMTRVRDLAAAGG